jgi:hypothetical protein
VAEEDDIKQKKAKEIYKRTKKRKVEERRKERLKDGSKI